MRVRAREKFNRANEASATAGVAFKIRIADRLIACSLVNFSLRVRLHHR